MQRVLLFALGALVVAVVAGGATGATTGEERALPGPLPEAVPDRDPPADTGSARINVERTPELVAAVKGRHPRLLFSAEDIPALKRLAEGEGKVFFEQLEAYLPACKPFAETEFLTNDTDGLRQGMWRIPTVALDYVLTGKEQSREWTIGFLRKLQALDHWQLGEEQDSGMGAANILAGAALAYDWLYHDLDPALRETFRQKLLLMARRMYYGGHLEKNPGAHYWQQDPQNNHRWHRDAGLGLAVLAIAGDGPGDEWLLSKVYDELRFIHEWLPEDGTCHESPGYMVFGGPYLTLAIEASDRCFGTHYLDHPFFRHTPLFRMHTLTPGFKDAFPFGDSDGLGYFNNYLLKCTAHHHLNDADTASGRINLQAGLWRLFEADRDAFDYGWFSLVWYDPSVRGGSLDRLPTTALYPDLGVAFVRDSWGSDAVGAMFKCGPYGGRRLNQYRNANDLHYINVAHDDPDANMFVIFAGGQFLADDDRYSTQKMTCKHNTILVNGKGQKGEGDEWTQPLDGVDMSNLATLTTWKDAGEVVVAEGEAGRMYEGLSRYRRAFIWVRGSYLLVLDDIRAEKEAEITWLVQGPQVEVLSVAAGGLAASGAQRRADEAQHSYQLGKGEARRSFRVLSDRAFSAAVADSTADDSGRSLGYRQLQLRATTARWRVAALFDPWNHQQLRFEMKELGPESADVAGGGLQASGAQRRVVVTITGPDFADVWQWQAAGDSATPATFHGQRRGGFSVTVDARDRAPLEGPPVTR